MVTLFSAFRSLGTSIYSTVCGGFSKITNLFRSIFSRSTPQTSPTDLRSRVSKPDQKTPLLATKTDGNPAAQAAKSTTSSQVTFTLPSDKKPATLAGKPKANTAAKSVAASVTAASPKIPFALPANISAAAAIAMSKGAGATPSLATHHSPFRVVDQPKDGNCFFHSLKAGLEHLKHSEQSKAHKELRQDMVRLIREKNFSLGATIYQEIIDLQSKLIDDFASYKTAKKHAKGSGQQIDRQALIQSILERIPSYIRTFVEIGGISVTSPPKTVHETYEKLISGLEQLSCLALDDSFNGPKFAPVIRSYLETISHTSCFVNILSAAPLMNALGVRAILHADNPQFNELDSVGPEGGQVVHLVQAGNHFNLLIPN